MIKNTVQKAMTPEEMTVLENIGSLVQQLMATGNSMGAETDVMNAGVVPEENKPEEEMGMAMKESNGPTANPEDKAEDRVELPTDITESNLSEVGKSLSFLLPLLQGMQKAQVRKSAPVASGNDAAVMQSLVEISKVMKSLADQQNQQNTAISNILEGMGFTENVQKSLDNKVKPVQDLSGAGILQELTSVLKNIGAGNQNNTTVSNNQWEVQKSSREALAAALPQIFGIK